MRHRITLPVILVAVMLVACGGKAKDTGSAGMPASPTTGPAGEQVFNMEVTSAGFVPNKLTAAVNKPIKLVITRKAEKTCATEIVIKDYGVNQKLPLNQTVEVVFTPTRTGQVHFACAMDMIKGEIEVK